MEFLTSYPSNVTKMLSKNGRISSSDVEILKTPFPSDFPNAAEVEKLKNSKISKKTFEIMHFMNFKRAVDNMIEYRNGEYRMVAKIAQNALDGDMSHVIMAHPKF